jgi:hypothetical protein
MTETKAATSRMTQFNWNDISNRADSTKKIPVVSKMTGKEAYTKPTMV